MDYKEQIEQAKHAAEKWREKHRIVGVGELRVDCMVDDITRSITDLLARAEAAEARAEKAERERDAAVRQLASLEICGYCKNGQCTTRGGTKECKWEWNGGQKEE